MWLKSPFATQSSKHYLSKHTLHLLEAYSVTTRAHKNLCTPAPQNLYNYTYILVKITHLHVVQSVIYIYYACRGMYPVDGGESLWHSRGGGWGPDLVTRTCRHRLREVVTGPLSSGETRGGWLHFGLHCYMYVHVQLGHMIHVNVMSYALKGLWMQDKNNTWTCKYM